MRTIALTDTARALASAIARQATRRHAAQLLVAIAGPMIFFGLAMRFGIDIALIVGGVLAGVVGLFVIDVDGRTGRGRPRAT